MGVSLDEARSIREPRVISLICIYLVNYPIVCKQPEKLSAKRRDSKRLSTDDHPRYCV